MPTLPPPKAERPDYDKPLGVAKIGERRQKKRWTDEELVEAMVRFLDSLSRGERPTEDCYDAWTAAHPDEPWTSALTRNGGLAAIRREAQRLRRQRRALR